VVEGTGAAVVAATTVTMVPADNSGNGGDRQWRQQAETEAAVGADNNQPKSGSNISGRNSHCGSNIDSGSGGSSDSSNGGANSSQGGTNSGQGGGRCSGSGGGMRYEPKRWCI
jgi:hypothetical protein